MFGKFKLQGNVSGAIRSDEDMENVNKDIADSSYKQQKKKLDIFMKERGFVKYKTNAYIRRNEIDVLECISLQKERYGSKTFTVNFALISLYIPHDFLSFDLGDRLGKLICNKDVWWAYSDETVARLSFQNVMQAIDELLLPWFDEKFSKKALKKELLREGKKNGGQLSDIQQKWLNVIDSDDDFSEIINKNIDILKLPSALFQNNNQGNCRGKADK